MESEYERSEDLWHRFLHSVLAPDHFWEPRADVYETREAIKVKVELAGVRPDSILVELAGDGRTLTVAGAREDARHEAADRVLFHQMEIYLGPFERVIALPADADVARDQVDAVYRDGFLLVTLPRKQGSSTQVRVAIEE